MAYELRTRGRRCGPGGATTSTLTRRYRKDGRKGLRPAHTRRPLHIEWDAQMPPNMFALDRPPYTRLKGVMVFPVTRRRTATAWEVHLNSEFANAAQHDSHSL